MGHSSRDERGSLAPMVVILALMILSLAGLVIDGGRQLGARSRAVGYAQEAARVGAATIDLNADVAKIDVEQAKANIAKFCGQVRSDDTAVQVCSVTEVDPEQVRVHVELHNETTLLSLVGPKKLTARGDGEAHAEQGIVEADETPTVPPLTVIPTKDPPGVTVAPTADDPTLDIPCPSWTSGSPTPTWTLPFPFPVTCKPTLPATDKPPNPNDPTDTETTEPGGG
jgi:Putative Flp pilus-assembly TadE/G-like